MKTTLKYTEKYNNMTNEEIKKKISELINVWLYYTQPSARNKTSCDIDYNSKIRLLITKLRIFLSEREEKDIEEIDRDIQYYKMFLSDKDRLDNICLLATPVKNNYLPCITHEFYNNNKKYNSNSIKEFYKFCSSTIRKGYKNKIIK